MLLVYIQINQSSFTVIQHLSHQLEQFGFRRSCSRETPSQRHIGSLQTEHLFHDRLLQRRFRLEIQLRQIFIRFHTSEIPVDRSYHFIRIKVSRHTDSHIIGHIPFFVVILDIGNRRILQVLLRSQHRLRSIRMIREKGGHNLLIHLAVVFRQRHILFFIYRLQFRMETADYVMLEAVRLYFGPVLHLVGGNILHIHRHIVTGIGIRTVRPDSGHQFVIFVRNSQLGSLVRNTVDFLIQSKAFRFIRRFAVNFKQSLYLVQQRLLQLIVLGTESLRSLKHQVLEIMSQSRRLRRVVLSSHPHGYISLNPGFFGIYRQIHLQAVI